MAKITTDITFWIDPDNKIAAADITVFGTEHQTADIREWCGDIVVSKGTAKAAQRILACDDTSLKYGYAKKTLTLEVDIYTERYGLTYVNVGQDTLRSITKS